MFPLASFSLRFHSVSLLLHVGNLVLLSAQRVLRALHPKNWIFLVGKKGEKSADSLHAGESFHDACKRRYARGQKIYASKKEVEYRG